MNSGDGKAKQKKGKGKSLPKLKTILANPKKEKCSSLGEDELQELGALITSSIVKSGLSKESFATRTHTHIGLESSLRAINNSKCSCVLLSNTIQPIFLIRLIARNVEAKNETVPVYVQTQLEDFTKNIFGVRALALTLPTVDEMRTAKLDEKLLQWVVARTKSAKPKLKRIIPNIKNIVKKKKTIQATQVPEIKIEEPTREKQEPQVSESEHKKWEGEFIALSDATVVERADFEEDQQNLTAALSKVVQIVKKNTIADEKMKKIQSDTSYCIGKFEIGKDGVNSERHNKSVQINSSDSDDFLPEVYQPLTVHKIKPNPNKKPKKKRQKKNQSKK